MLSAHRRLQRALAKPAPNAPRHRRARSAPCGSCALALLLFGLNLVLATLARGEAAGPGAPDPAVTAPSTPGVTAPLLPSTGDRRVHGAQSVPPPADLNDLPAWLDYRARNHLVALPLEARIFYRRGLVLAGSGARDEAIRMVRGAAELDPTFVAPHLTLGAWLFVGEPSQALLQYATVMELARQSFMLQLALAGNLLFLAFQSLLAGLLAAGLIIVLLRNRQLRHAWIERLGAWSSPRSARGWSFAILALPFLCGFGLALPTVLFLGLLWPVLRATERAAFVALLALLVTAPWVAGALDRLALPLREGQSPFYGVPLVATEPYSQDRAHELQALARREPGDGFVQFAAAWTARRGGDLGAAEEGYRRALRLWPDDDRILNNLGNILAVQGRTDEALALYRRAGDANPANAAAAFNASQIFTRRFDYHSASEAVSRASALNFDLVKTYQSQATDDGALPLVDEWIAPRSFWNALSNESHLAAGRGALPPPWRACLEFSGPGFSVAALVLALLALLLGILQHRAAPLRSCSNCDEVLCRRCAQRRRETALCPACAAAEARAETRDFGRVLLLQRRRRVRRVWRVARTALATLIPGFGLLSFHRVLAPVVLLAMSAALLAVAMGVAAPFSHETRLVCPDPGIPGPLLAGLGTAVYLISIAGYFAAAAKADAEEAAQNAPVRSRVRRSGGERAAIAA